LSGGMYVGPHIVLGKPTPYTFARDVPPSYVSLHGVWTSTDQDVVSGAGAEIRLNFESKDVFMVLGGRGTITVMLGHRQLGRLRVDGYTRNYTIIKGSHLESGLLQLDMSPGISAYDFTFG